MDRRGARTLCCAVLKEGTPVKYQLRAVEPGSRRPLVESYETTDQVAARRVQLERAGYTVLVTVDETVPEGWVRPSASKPRW